MGLSVLDPDVMPVSEMPSFPALVSVVLRRDGHGVWPGVKKDANARSYDPVILLSDPLETVTETITVADISFVNPDMISLFPVECEFFAS